MSKVDADSAGVALMELCEAFGVPDGSLSGLLPVAMEGRLFLRDDGKAVYILAKPVELHGGKKLEEITLRMPKGKDFGIYSKGMTVKVAPDGSAEVDAVMMATRTMKTVAQLSGESPAVVEEIGRPDLRTLEGVCDALGFFD